MISFSTSPLPTSNIAEAIAVCEALANGDFEARITNFQNDRHLRLLFEAINRLAERTDSYIRETSAAMEHNADNTYNQKVRTQDWPGAFRHGVDVVNKTIDKTHRLNTTSAALQERVNSLLKSVHGVGEDIVSAAEEAVLKTDTTSSKTLEVSEATLRAAKNISIVSDATRKMTESCAAMANQISISARTANQARTLSELATSKMNSLVEAARNIGSVVSLISDIAGQTNLLALNATIEAARAGGDGKGFSVVASEVKNLAHQTSQATETVGEQIAHIQQMTDDVVSEITDLQAATTTLDELNAHISTYVSSQNDAQSEISGQIGYLRGEIDLVSSHVVDVVQTAAVSYASSIQVIWSADDMKRPLQNISNEMHEYIKIMN